VTLNWEWIHSLILRAASGRCGLSKVWNGPEVYLCAAYDGAVALAGAEGLHILFCDSLLQSM